MRPRSKTRRPGRPHAAEPLAAWITVRVTAEDKAYLEALAAAAGQDLAAFVRDAALKRRAPRPPLPRLHFNHVHQLARIGNNLNQCVHLLHTGTLTPDFSSVLSELSEELKALKRLFLGLESDVK